MSVTDIHAYHQLITNSYDQRSKNYHESEPHRDVATQLVDYRPPHKNDRVLDAATGTGNVAFHAADKVGPDGYVVGVDLSRGMIEKAHAHALLSESGHNNMAFLLGDAEHLPCTPNSFDRIYCASAFFWIADKAHTLNQWFDVLRPGGVVGFHAWPEESYVFGYVARQVLKKYGIDYLAHSPYGSIEKSTRLLKDAGFVDAEVIVVEEGSYLSLEEAKDCWINEDHYPIGQYPHPVSVMTEDILAQARADYEAEMGRRNTEDGVWNDTSIYYVYGRKPSNTTTLA